jgi:hypothetical protein
MTKYTCSALTLTELERRARSGNISDIDYLMENLEVNNSFVHCKMIDYALGLVSSQEGRERIKYFLFNGSQIQRNYAALYFKRLGADPVIDEAFQQGCIDEIQAYSR